jgi:fumarate reductase flavoprotein subunit
VIERDAVPAGSTALSAGLIAAAGTRFQRAAGIEDDPALFADDLRVKAKDKSDPVVVTAVARGSGPLIEWLANRYGFPFDVVTDFNYPGHSALRMHGLPSRSGAELIDRLRDAVEGFGVPIVTNAAASCLFAEPDGRVRGVEVKRGGATERVGCDALVLACSGFGGNASLVRRHIPAMADALYFGHHGNCGEAILWGEALGAQLDSLSAYQGHGSVATPHNILITWAVIMEGGVQINAEGCRFSDETRGYSEQAALVLRQPGGVAFNVFDQRIAGIARQFQDFRDAEAAGALVAAASLEELAARIKVPAENLCDEMKKVAQFQHKGARDGFGRDFSDVEPLAPPFIAVKVTGALFHTQGGLAVDKDARVLRASGAAFPNLLAAGGAAAGVSGSTAEGYLSGNGLLTATVLGRLAGRAAAL